VLRSTHPAQPIFMRKTEQYTEAEAGPHGKRAHTRRKLGPMAYIELGQENGGILLNLGEGGFAVQSALALTSREFSELRFQVPAFQGWLTASGRIVWLSDSRKEAGIQFTELPAEARREIQKWVSAEGDSERPTRAVAARANTAREPAPTVQSPSRLEKSESPEPANARTEQRADEADRERPAPWQPVTVAVAEPPAQDFRFGDYSLFSPEPEKASTWGEPGRRPRNWGGGALVGFLVAVLFFALGAAMGRGGADRLITYLDGLKQLTPAPRVTPPDPPDATGAADPSENNKETTSAGNQDRSKGDESTGAVPEAAASSENGKGRGSEANGSEAQMAKPAAGANGESAPRNSEPRSPERNTNERRALPSSEVAPRKNPPVESDAGRVANEHSILVNAPEPGSPPFYVSLPGEAISASASVAMSARRTLEIMPLRAGETGRAERVVIGKLIARSEPFYPVEARNRHIEGSVELRARVGRTGEIISVTPVSGPKLLISAATTAVREWRYEPTFIDGDPAETLADIFVLFRLP